MCNTGTDTSESELKTPVFQNDQMESAGNKAVQHTRMNRDESRLDCFIRNFRKKTFQGKFFYSMSLCLSFLFLGWIKGQAGPALNDLLIITDVGLEEGSAFRTAYYCGIIIGCISAALLYRKVYVPTFLVAVLVVDAVLVAVLPWCSLYPLMVTVHVPYGVCGGILESFVFAESVKVWKKKSKSFVQCVNFAFAVGSIISPLVCSPFVTNVGTPDVIDINNTEYKLISFFNRTKLEKAGHVYAHMGKESSYINNTKTHIYEEEGRKSNIFNVYIISSVLLLFTAISFVFSGIKYRNCNENMEEKSETLARRTNLPMRKKIIALFIVCCLAALSNGVDYAFFDFLAIFCVRHMQLSPVEGAFRTSFVFITILIARFFCIFIVCRFQMVHILTGCYLILLLSNTGLVLTAYFHSSAGLWICSVVIGIALSASFACLLSWTNEAFMPVTGWVSSSLVLSAFLGSAINPLILSCLITSFSTMWFSYLLTIESSLCLFVFFTAHIYSKHFVNFRTEISQEIIVKQENLLNPCQPA